MEDSSTVMFGRKTTEVRTAFDSMWVLIMKEDSPTVMFGGKTSEIKSTIENMSELFLKGRIANCNVWKEDFGWFYRSCGPTIRRFY